MWKWGICLNALTHYLITVYALLGRCEFTSCRTEELPCYQPLHSLCGWQQHCTCWLQHYYYAVQLLWTYIFISHFINNRWLGELQCLVGSSKYLYTSLLKGYVCKCYIQINNFLWVLFKENIDPLCKNVKFMLSFNSGSLSKTSTRRPLSEVQDLYVIIWVSGKKLDPSRLSQLVWKIKGDLCNWVWQLCQSMAFSLHLRDTGNTKYIYYSGNHFDCLGGEHTWVMIMLLRDLKSTEQ